MTGLMDTLLHENLGDKVEIMTPPDSAQRGCQLSLRLTGRRDDRKSRREVFDALGERDVVCDWREPDVIRVAPVPLYNTFEEVWRFVALLAECLE